MLIKIMRRQCSPLGLAKSLKFDNRLPGEGMRKHILVMCWSECECVPAFWRTTWQKASIVVVFSNT